MTHAREAGFTLAEALVSLFVFALVAGGSVIMLSQSLNAQQRVSDAQEQLRSLQAARALLIFDVAQIAPRIPRQENRLPAVFLGTGGVRPVMSFVRAVGERGSEDRISTALVVIEYALDDDGRIIRHTRAALDPGGDARETSRILLAGAKDVHFEFNTGGAWVQDWPVSAFGAPSAVAIVATLPRYGVVRLQAMTGL